MRKVFEFFSNRHMLTTLFTLIIVLLGLNSIRTLKRDILPEIDFGELIITTPYPGASPEDVELNVTNRIEDELKNVTGIKRITSTSMENLSVVDVVVDFNAKDIEKVKSNIREAVSRVTDLPEEVTESPLIREVDTSEIGIVEVGMAGDIPYRELRDLARQFEKKLEDVNGVSRVERYGYRAREIKVEVDPKALESLEIPMQDIVQAIRARNIRLTGGTFESYTSEKNVVTLAQFKNPAEVRDVIVRTSFDGPLIKVEDLAIVKDDFEDETILSRMEGKKAITFTVHKTTSADIIRTVNAVKRLIEKECEIEIAGSVTGSPEEIDSGEEKKSRLVGFAKGVVKREPQEKKVYRYGPAEILLANDISLYVKNRFQIVLTNGAIGLLLVVLMLSLFLNLRTSFWVAMGIPVSVLGTIFLLPLFNGFLDSISLFSLILVIGIIVDDGIIISESIYYRKSIGDTPLEAAVKGTQLVFLPVLTTILTTFLAFAPMLFMKGIFGKFVFVIPLTVSLALFISFFESVFALPAHLKRGMEKKRRAARGEATRKWFLRLRKFYRIFSFRFLKFRYPIVLLFIAVFASTLWYAKNSMDFILFTSKSAERFLIEIELPTGTPLQATSEKTREIEAAVEELPRTELKTFMTRIGALQMTSGQAENYASIFVDLTPYSERTRTASRIIEDLRQRMDRIEGVENIRFVVLAEGPPVGKPITLRVIGNNDERRKALTDAIVSYLGTIRGVKDIDRDDKAGKEQIEIELDYENLARLGLTVADVARNVRIAYDGELVTSTRDGDEDVGYRIRLAETARKDLVYLRDLVIPNRQGRLIKLREVARLTTGPGPNAFRHFDGERTTTIEADVDQDSITPLEATTAVLRQFNVQEDWPQMKLVVGGEAEESMESIRDLLVAFFIAFIGIYFLLILLFNSFTQPLLVMIAIPFGIIGVILALALHGEPLSFMAMIGTIGLAGVVVNDSLVLVNHLNELKAQNPEESIVKIVAQGTADRLRAIILTTLTTVAGLLPLAYGIGGTDVFLSPMALALGYGLLFATPLTLVLVPCLYVIGNDIGSIFKRR